MGINAHINLDLGIASAEVVGADGIGELKSDFMRVNSILRALVDVIQRGINKISPAFKLADRVLLDGDELWFAFELEKARDAAWIVAQDVAVLPEAQRPKYIARLDAAVAARGRRIANPGPWLCLPLKVVGLLESDNVAKNLRKLRKLIG